ncbi:MAG: TonB-dependent receptor, partial [Siphonobacter sp.]
LRSDGFSAARDTTGQQSFDKEGFWQDNVLANMGVQLNSRLLWKLRGVYSRYKTDLDWAAFTDEKDYTATNTMKLFGTGFEYTHAKGKLTLNYSVSSFNRLYLNDSTYTTSDEVYSKGTYGGVTHYAEIYHTWNAHKNFDLLTGVDFRTQNTNQSYLSYSEWGPYESTPIGKDTASTRLFSAYVTGLFHTKAGLSVEVGGRYNHHSLYGSNVTYSFNPSYLISNRLKAFVNVSSGFRAPSLYQLYSPYGNKNLKPENSRSFEAGLQFFAPDGKSNIRALYFDRHIKNGIVYQSKSSYPYGVYANYDKQHDHGVEIEGQYQLGKLSLTANATFVTGKITKQVSGHDTSYANLYRRPKSLVNATIGYQITPKLFASATIRSVGQRPDQFYNSATYQTEIVNLNAYHTLDIYAEYRINGMFRVYGDIRNLMDEQYYDIYGYTTRGRNATIGVQVSF